MKIRSIWTKFVSGVGFSNGWALFAPKNPPPFVPYILMASCEATGPCAIVCVARVSRFTLPSGFGFSLICGSPPFALRHEEEGRNQTYGQQHPQERPRGVHPEVPDGLRFSPRDAPNQSNSESNS